MKPYKAVIFDLDGTLFRGEEPIAGAADTVLELQGRGILIRYLTNNSSRTLAFYADKLRRLGFPATESEVYSSALGTAKYLASEGLWNVCMIGEEGLRQTLVEHGITVGDREPSAVVVGLSKSFDYDQMSRAMQYIRAGARFVATNADPTYPVEGGRFIPGSGSVVAAVRTCSETEPFVVGKPNPFLVELALAEASVMPQDALVVGDRMDTDIESGRRAGCDTLLVLSGAAQSAPAGQPWAPDVTVLSQREPLT